MVIAEVREMKQHRLGRESVDDEKAVHVHVVVL